MFSLPAQTSALSASRERIQTELAKLIYFADNKRLTDLWEALDQHSARHPKDFRCLRGSYLLDYFFKIVDEEMEGRNLLDIGGEAS